jgi:glucose-1-phosphate cytidylyltransferase
VPAVPRGNCAVKVVIFCGGLGTRLRAYSDTIPKPLVPLGGRPILWHVMKYYAHHGHTDFALCLGYKGELIREYFNSDTDWSVTFVESGLNSSIGERLAAARPFLTGEDVFLANYADGLTDYPLQHLIDEFRARRAVAMFLSVRPHYSGHFVRRAPDGRVLAVVEAAKADAWINGGYFVFSGAIFDYLRAGEDLVEQPFQRLIAENKLFTCDYQGFWRAVDTYKDLQTLEAILEGGNAPWQVW